MPDLIGVTSPAPIRICIIEDHGVVRAGLKMLLESHPGIEVVAEAVNRQEAFEAVRREHPDLLLIDLRLGRELAVDFLEELLAFSKARAIILTADATEGEIARAVHAGATGLVYKEEGSETLIRAIHKVHSGEAWLSRSIMTSALARFRGAGGKTKPDGEAAKIARLTPREREIVVLVGAGLNRKRIAEKLFVSEATVRNHLSSIFGKLDVSSQFELLFYAQRHGLTDEPSQTGPNS